MIENVLSIDIKIWKISEFREWLIAKNKNQKNLVQLQISCPI